jgi:transcriptional regulator with XRE-family HTH domain
MMPTRSPDPVDRYVGSRVRMRRIMLGISQDTLANALGITFQQVQKYESGTNRIAAGRMLQISRALRVPVSFLFEGAPGTDNDGADGLGETPLPNYVSDLSATKDGLALARAFTMISELDLRRSIVHMVEKVAASKGPNEG